MSPRGGGQKTTGPGDSTIIYLLIKKQPLQHLEEPRRLCRSRRHLNSPTSRKQTPTCTRKLINPKKPSAACSRVGRPPEQTQPGDSKLASRRVTCSSRSPPEGRPTGRKLTFSAGGQLSEFEKSCTAVRPCAACCSSCVHASVVKQTHGALQACLHKQVFQLKANVSCMCEAPFLRCSSGVPQVFLRCSSGIPRAFQGTFQHGGPKEQGADRSDCTRVTYDNR